jgi:DNA-binding sugar fermentation-stimulating protein
MKIGVAALTRTEVQNHVSLFSPDFDTDTRQATLLKNALKKEVETLSKSLKQKDNCIVYLKVKLLWYYGTIL